MKLARMLLVHQISNDRNPFRSSIPIELGEDYKMPEDRMQKDKNMGRGEQNYGQKSPGRGKHDDDVSTQKGGNQGTSGRDMDDQSIDNQHGGRTGKGGRQGGGQNR